MRSGHWFAVLTRETDIDLPNSVRPEIANHINPEAYISIHCNGHRQYRRGFSVIWYMAQENSDSRALAVKIARTLLDAGFIPDMTMGPRFTVPRGEKNAPDYQLTEDDLPVYVREKIDHRMIFPARMPAVLIETHYLSNAIDSLRFSRDSVVERFCAALEKALAEFFSQNGEGASAADR
jgi:N-acetylmuramoyl-L-alanine amidase